jgi:predicted nucleic acid-binding protein
VQGRCNNEKRDSNVSGQGPIPQASCILLSKNLEKNAPSLTSNYILVETYTRIRYDDGHAKAVQFDSVIQEAIKIGRLHLEWVTPAIHQEAWKNFERFTDQVFSFVDCTSFVIARNIGVVEVFGFDEHFKTMGFTLKP